MTENRIKGGTKHYGAYPEGPVSPLLAYAFRPFFLLLAAHILLSIVLWGLTLGRVFPLLFLGDPFAWHIYEMVFGTGSAAIAAFILTAVPEFYSGAVPVVGRRLGYLVLLWVLGRVAFWLMKWVGMEIVILTNLPFLLWVVALVARPILEDPTRKNARLLATMLGLWLIQAWYLAVMAGWVAGNPMQILRVGVGGFMVLELLAIRRIATESINEWFEAQGIDDLFLARPPRYNLAVFCVVLYTAVEFFQPGNSLLGWLGLAAAAGVFHTLNDFFLTDEAIVHKPQVFPLFLILVLMGVGYGLLGWDHLDTGVHAGSHFRHLLTSGVMGLSYLVVMVTVSNVHTGREIVWDRWMNLALLLLLAGTAMRATAYLVGNMLHWHMGTALVWGLPFLIYGIRYQRILRSPRADGLPG